MRRKQMWSVLAVCIMLCGCGPMEKGAFVDAQQHLVYPTKTGSVPNATAEIMTQIWEQYEPQERFAVYGGVPTAPVIGEVGTLRMREDLDKWYPFTAWEEVEQGASLAHLLSERIFTCLVVRLKETEKLQLLAASWRQELHESVWSSGAPERILLVKIRPGYLLMAYGNEEQMDLLRQKIRCAYPKARILYSEPMMAQSGT